MSCCKYRDRDYDRCYDDRDYWFKVGRDCDSYHRRCPFRPIFPRVLQANLIIPQTSIPIQIVVGGQTGLLGGTSILQSISLMPQTVESGAAVPFTTNFATGGVFTGF